MATRPTNACPEARRIHDQIVVAARARHLGGQAPWWQELDLRHVPTERHLDEWLSERALAVAQLEGIDVSLWQGLFPWNEAAVQGILLGIAKASEGEGYTDPQWGRNVSALLAPGPIVGGSYHFLRPDLGNNPVTEALWYLSRHPAACFATSQPWVFSLDAESNGGSASGCYAFLDAVSSRIGYSCWFYSYSSWITSRGVQATSRPLWEAWPNPAPMPNLGWPAVTMQQYGLRGFSVGQVDANRFFGPMATLLKLAGAGASGSTGGLSMADATTIQNALDVLTERLNQPFVDKMSVAGNVINGWPTAGVDPKLNLQARLDALTTIDVVALAAALAPHLPPMVDEAKLAADLEAVLPGADAAAIKAAFAKALGA